MVMLKLITTILLSHTTFAFVGPSTRSAITSQSLPPPCPSALHRPSSKLYSAANEEISKAPTLNGKVVLPTKAMTAGLKGHKVAAVYAVLNSNYKRGSGEGWQHVEHVSITRDLASDINYFLAQKGADSVAHVRAMSFSYPQKAVMEDYANGWRVKVHDAGGDTGRNWGMVPSEARDEVAAQAEATTESDYDYDDEDDMDEDELDDYIQMMAESRARMGEARGVAEDPPPLFVDNTASNSAEIVSPFESSQAATTTNTDGQPLELNSENVDKVLDEVRPYLISDGGNVSVQNVDAGTGNVYLLLEGACGSCASSTVTMKMGIERVLKEKFEDKLGEVIQVDPDDEEGGGKATELTMESVQLEVNRISTAIIAMGGVVRVVSVNPIGEVEIEFRGPNKVKKGLELALLDVEYVKHVKFVS